MTAPGLAGGSDEAGIVQVPAGIGAERAGTAADRPPGTELTGVAAERAEGESGAPDRWQRLSRRSMIVRPLTDLVRLLPLLAGLLILHTQTGSGLVWGVVASVFAVVTGLVHWATTRYLITGERIYLRRGLLNQKTLSVARDRIRTVDVTAHPLHRMLGVCRVSIGTGRNDLRSSESFHLDGVTRSEAESLRIVLLTGASAAAEAGQETAADRAASPAAAAAAPAAEVAAQQAEAVAPQAGAVAPQAGAVAPQAGAVAQQSGAVEQQSGAVEQQSGVVAQAAETAQAAELAAAAAGQEHAGEHATEIVRLRLGWLRFAPLTTTGLVVLGVLFGAVIQITNATDINLAATDPVRRVVTDFTALSVVQRILAGGPVVLACYVLIAMAGYIAVFWNFRLARHGADTLRVTRGLLSVRATTISLSRLRGVEISEPLLLRAARGARCIAITTGLHVGRGAEREGSVLSPPAPRAVARRVASSVLGLPDAICSGPLEPHGPAARRRRYVRALASAAAVIAAVYLATRAQDGPAWIWIASFALLPASALLAADRYRSLGHRLAGGWLVTRTGSLARRRNIISTDAIIGWRIHQTWFQRRQGLMTLTATTAAGQQHYAVRDVPAAQGLALAAAATGDLLLPFLRELSGRDLPARIGVNRTHDAEALRS